MSFPISDDSLPLRPVSYFSAALADAMASSGIETQTELMKRSGVTQASISNYLAGDIPKEEHVKKLCKALNDHCASLALAYMRDKTPPEFRKFVKIDPTDPSAVNDVGPPPWDSLPAKQRQLIEDAVRACKDRKNFVAALRALLEL